MSCSFELGSYLDHASIIANHFQGGTEYFLSLFYSFFSEKFKKMFMNYKFISYVTMFINMYRFILNGLILKVSTV